MNGHDASDGQLSRDEWGRVVSGMAGPNPAHSAYPAEPLVESVRDRNFRTLLASVQSQLCHCRFFLAPSLLRCGDVEANPGPYPSAPPNAVVNPPDLKQFDMVIFVDGGCTPNPGTIAAAAVVAFKLRDGTPIESIVATRFVSTRTTNNIMESLALLGGARLAEGRTLLIGDSENCLLQALGVNKCNAPHVKRSCLLTRRILENPNTDITLLHMDGHGAVKNPADAQCTWTQKNGEGSDDGCILALDIVPYTLGDDAVSDRTQKYLSKALDRAIWSTLLEDATSVEDRARIRATAGPEAGAFWNVIPNPHLGLNIDSPLFVTTAKWWLGLPVLEPNTVCRHCGERQDVFGYHSLTCRGGGKLGIRHNAIARVLFEHAVAALFCPEEEVMIHEHTRERSDLRVKILGRFKDVDVSVTNPLRPSYVVGTAAGSLPSAADRYVADEKGKYVTLCAQAVPPTIFVPCSLDCYGNWGTEGKKFVKELASARASLSSGQEAHVYERRIIQQCSVALMISNARAIAKGRLFHAAEAIREAAEDTSSDESDADDGEMWVLAAQEGTGGPLIIEDDDDGFDVFGTFEGSRYEGTVDISKLDAGELAKLASGPSPHIPPFRALAELARRIDDLGEAPIPGTAQAEWYAASRRLATYKRTVNEGWRSRHEESDTEASDVEEGAEPVDAGPSDGEVEVHRDGEEEMVAFLAEMEEKEHGWPRHIAWAEDIASNK